MAELGINTIFAVDIEQDEPLTKEHFDMIRSSPEEIPESLAAAIISKIQTPTDEDEIKLKKWYDLLSSYMQSLSSIEILEILIAVCDQDLPDTATFAAFFSALPQEAMALLQEDKIKKAVNATQVLLDLEKGVGIAGVTFADLDGFVLSDAIAKRMYTALQRNVNNDFGAKIIVKMLNNPSKITWKAFSQALNEGRKLYEAYRHRSGKSEEERLKILEATIPYLNDVEEKRDLKNAKEEMQRLHGSLAWTRYLQNKATLEDLDIIMKSEIDPLQQMTLITDLTKRKSSIATRIQILTRFTQLKKAHPASTATATTLTPTTVTTTTPKWDDLSCLQRAVRQLLVIERMKQSSDVSLGDLSSLLRRNLSDEEKTALLGIIQSKTSGEIARKIVGKNKALDAAVADVIADIVASEPLTYENLSHLQGVKLSETQGATVAQHLAAANRATSPNPHLQAIAKISADFTAEIKKKTNQDPPAHLALPIALTVYRFLNRSQSASLLAQKVFHAPETHIPGTLLEVGNSAILSISKRSFQKFNATKVLGEGTFKKCDFCFQIVKTVNQARAETTYSVAPRARLIAKTEAVAELEHEIENTEAFQDQGRFVKLHGYVYYGTVGKPKLAAIYDLCDGTLNQAPLTVSQQITALHGVLGGVKGMHDKDVLHRDLKPQNILISRDTASSSNPSKQEVHSFVADLNLSQPKTDGVNFNGTLYGTERWTSPELHVNSSADPYLVEAYAVGATFLAIREKKDAAPGYMDFVDDRNKVYSSDRVTRMKEQLTEYQAKFKSAVDKIEGSNRQSEIPTEEEVICYILAKLLHTDFSTPTAPTSQGRWRVGQALTKFDELLLKIKTTPSASQTAQVQVSASVQPTQQQQTHVVASAPLPVHKEPPSVHI